MRHWVRQAGHEVLTLVSLADAVGYWRRAGFVDHVPQPAAALVSYGEGARYMRLALTP
ncbi:hypothetical protein [Denitromonas iodatirespirans]|uniref:GNAT family N-acetyltransferase n=1 Tax=Denitromonas iodatirespirans TaxID=2795389 RepID=A0A944D606_DENI1|nr:hypothetical protein [Denitromonas iodatirespirans]MBT0960554.1 hypothetical protein [Denitromonas iodatirespirans]